MNQRERRNSESFWRTSLSLTNSNAPVAATAQINGRKIHLLHAPARASGASSTVTSAFSSQRSRNRAVGRSWLSARASMLALIPPAEAPASDIDDDPQLELAADLAQQLEIFGLGVVFRIFGIG